MIQHLELNDMSAVFTAFEMQQTVRASCSSSTEIRWLTSNKQAKDYIVRGLDIWALHLFIAASMLAPLPSILLGAAKMFLRFNKYVINTYIEFRAYAAHAGYGVQTISSGASPQ